jgi:hypothetical protein
MPNANSNKVKEQTKKPKPAMFTNVSNPAINKLVADFTKNKKGDFRVRFIGSGTSDKEYFIERVIIGAKLTKKKNNDELRLKFRLFDKDDLVDPDSQLGIDLYSSLKGLILGASYRNGDVTFSVKNNVLKISGDTANFIVSLVLKIGSIKGAKNIIGE